MTGQTSIMTDSNNETWLAIYSSVIRVFTSKNAAIDYRMENKDWRMTIMHRYADGSMEELACWPELSEDGSDPVVDMLRQEFKNSGVYFNVVDMDEVFKD